LNEVAEIVAGSREHGVDGIAARMGEIVAAHAVILFEMPDHRLDGCSAFELALDLRSDATLLAGSVDPELVLGRGVVAAIAGISDDAVEHIADGRVNRGIGRRINDDVRRKPAEDGRDIGWPGEIQDFAVYRGRGVAQPGGKRASDLPPKRPSRVSSWTAPQFRSD
jgi:hypothetical protein